MVEPTATVVEDPVINQPPNQEMTPKEKSAEEKSILDRLNTIRVGKSKILGALAMLKKKDDEGEKIDKTLIAKLVDSYDGLKVQEDEFICMLRKLAGIQEVTSPAADFARESSNTDPDQDFDYEEAHKTLADAEKMAEQASAAASINNQLQMQIALNQQKKSALAHIHTNKTQQKSQEASKAFQEVEFSKLKLASETESVDRKQRQLERLRKEAIKRGYIAASGGAKPADNQKKQVEQLLVRPVVVEAGETDSARVPPIPEVETKEKHSQVQPSDTEVKGSTSKDLKKDEFHARISERFAGFEARKQRMRLLRSRLNQLEEQKMDDAYGQAIDRLQNLTSMRKQLESMQAGEGTTSSSEAVKALAEEVEQLAETSSSSPSSREKSNVNELDSSKTPASQELDSGEEGQSATTDEVGDSATPIEQSFDSADGQKIDPVSQRLDTENGRLKKQRTLENVRIYANTNNPMEMGDRVEESLVCGNAEAKTEEPLGSSENGIEKEIFSVVEFIVTWIDEHKNDLVVQDALDGFRDAIILKTKEIFSPNEHPHSEDFDKQLGTVIDDCLAKYVGVNLALHKEGVILDLAENLYNEFAFIKLMNSVDSIGRK